MTHKLLPNRYEFNDHAAPRLTAPVQSATVAAEFLQFLNTVNTNGEFSHLPFVFTVSSFCFKDSTPAGQQLWIRPGPPPVRCC